MAQNDFKPNALAKKEIEIGLTEYNRLVQQRGLMVEHFMEVLAEILCLLRTSAIDKKSSAKN